MTSNIDFGLAAEDYASHRKGSPAAFFERFPLDGDVLDLASVARGSLPRLHFDPSFTVAIHAHDDRERVTADVAVLDETMRATAGIERIEIELYRFPTKRTRDDGALFEHIATLPRTRPARRRRTRSGERAHPRQPRVSRVKSCRVRDRSRCEGREEFARDRDARVRAVPAQFQARARACPKRAAP